MTFNFNKLKDNVLPVFQDVSHHGSILSFLRIPKERNCNCNSKENFKSSLTWDNSHPDKYTQVPTLVCPVWCTHVKSKANKRICKADNHCEVNQATPAWAITSKLYLHCQTCVRLKHLCSIYKIATEASGYTVVTGKSYKLLSQAVAIK